ncbi:MAG: response regulator [Vulcanimicrobiota bacterium]
MIKILIADDHPVVRRGLKQLIEENENFKVTAEANNGKEVLDIINDGVFDLILMDISMPVMNGLDTLKQLKIVKPEIPVLILSIHPEEQYALRVLRAGASGYLTKETAPEELVLAIRKVLDGGKYVSISLAEKLVLQLDNNHNAPVYKELSDREFQVFQMLARGSSVSDIAEELCLSVKTISTYRSRILQKMNMKNNSELTYYAMKNRLIE